MVGVVALIALLIEPPADMVTVTTTIDANKRIEEYLERWDATTEPGWELPSCLADGVESIEGVWHSGGGFDSTQLLISSGGGDGRFLIRLSTGGCLGGWTLDRSGVLKKAVLTLNKPTQAYARAPFTRLYVVHSKSGTALVPSTGIDALRTEYERSGCGLAIPSPMSVFWQDRSEAPPAARR